MAERNSYAAGSRYKFAIRFERAQFSDLLGKVKERALMTDQSLGRVFWGLYGKRGDTWPALWGEIDAEKAETIIRAHIQQYGGWR